MKKIIITCIVLLFASVAYAYIMQNSWQQIDQATDNTQANWFDTTGRVDKYLPQWDGPSATIKYVQGQPLPLTMAWKAFDGNTTVTSLVSKDIFPVPNLGWAGKKLVEVRVRCWAVGTGTVTVTLQKNNTVQMMSAGVTLTNAFFATGGTIKIDGSEVLAAGDGITWTAAVSGTAPLGLSVSGVYE